jgi:hypothetical protein
VTSYAIERAQDRIAALPGAGLDLVTLWREAGAIIQPLVPHFGAACWYTLDPASLLITSHFNEDMPVFPAEALAHEYYEDDVNKLADVVRSSSGASTLHEATGGDPSSSPRWHANMAMGGDQELIVGLRMPSGDAWGGLGLYREPGDPRFRPDEIEFLRAVAPSLAARCCSGRPATRRARMRPASSSSPRTGRSSRPRPAWSAGCRTYRTATGTPDGCPRPCSRWRARRCARPRDATRRARSRSRGC